MRIFVFVMTAVVTGLVVLFVLSWQRMSRFIESRRSRRLVLLASYHQRLNGIVSELLERTNDLDQESKYYVLDGGNEWSVKVGLLCEDLVRLADALNLVEQLIACKQIDKANRAVLLSCRVATRAGLKFRQLKQSGPAITKDKSDPV